MSSTILNQTVTSGLQIQQEIGGSGLKGAVIGNSSNLQATVIMQGAGISRTLYPYTVDFFDAPHDANGNLRSWSGNLQINFAVGAPDTGAYVQVDTIGATEPFKNTYPIALSRGAVNSTTVGNTLSYETGAAGTQVIDVGTNAHNKNLLVDNDGSGHWNVEQSGTVHTGISLNTSGNPVKLGESGDTTEVLGNLTVDSYITSNGQFGVSSAGDVIDGSGFDTFLNSRGGANVVHVGNAGTDDATFDQNGIHLSRGQYHFLSGNLSRVSAFSGTGTGTYTHNLGATPDIVIVMTHANGSQTVGYDSENGTTVHVTCGAGLAFNAFAIKYSG